MADVPKIRFKGFSDDWEQRKLGEILVSLQNNTLSRAELSKEKGIAKNIHYGDILVKYGEVLDVSKEELSMIADEKVLNKYSASFLQNGDVIMADTAEDSTVGKCSEIAGLTDDVVISGLHTIPYRPKIKFASGYLGYYLNSNAYHQQLIPLMQGIKVTSVSKSAMQNTDIIYPKSEEEQGRIGAYLKGITRLITLHQHKCDEIIELKKHMLQKMFPQKGKKTPEIRFAGFTGDWEQRKLGAIFKERTERATGDEELLSVTIGNGVIRQADSVKRNIASEDKSNYKIVRKGDVPYNSMRMWQGAVGNSEYDGIVSPAYTVLVPTAQANGKFFMELFKKESTLKIFQRWSQGLTSDTWNLKYPVLSSIEFYVPSIEEQTKIAENFKSLDNLITLYQRKCDELVKIKKYMLQNMFV
jgi:type I restriction enzyme S subunit